MEESQAVEAEEVVRVTTAESPVTSLVNAHKPVTVDAAAAVAVTDPADRSATNAVDKAISHVNAPQVAEAVVVSAVVRNATTADDPDTFHVIALKEAQRTRSAATSARDQVISLEIAHSSRSHLPFSPSCTVWHLDDWFIYSFFSFVVGTFE
ncbi:hypothetical protein ANCCAN_05067 [Ancylostoma caninum]|uniref:Uncharacterized protein n=1 Tax=Ancylostoma caninum TaxID=29170 RepID=A0A368GWS6_ANCCA|nr:hypothetical protein ANCCAN_05067 [Ancylostoma caninum]